MGSPGCWPCHTGQAQGLRRGLWGPRAALAVCKERKGLDARAPHGRSLAGAGLGRRPQSMVSALPICVAQGWPPSGPGVVTHHGRIRPGEASFTLSSVAPVPIATVQNLVQNQEVQTGPLLPGSRVLPQAGGLAPGAGPPWALGGSPTCQAVLSAAHGPHPGLSLQPLPAERSLPKPVSLGPSRERRSEGRAGRHGPTGT